MLEEFRRKIAARGVGNIGAIHVDLERDPLPSERYHMIVTGMALHHIADTEKTLRAFHALLLRDGTLCLADLDTEPGIFHSADMAAARKMLYEAGFTSLKRGDGSSVTLDLPYIEHQPR